MLALGTGAAAAAASMTLGLAATPAGASVQHFSSAATSSKTVRGDNGTVKIHRSTTPVTDRRNEARVRLLSRRFRLRLGPGGLVMDQVLAPDRRPVDRLYWQPDARRQRRRAHRRHDARERPLQAVLDLRGRARERHAQGVPGGLQGNTDAEPVAVFVVPRV